MTREQIVSYFFVGLFIFILYQLFLIFSPFLNAIFWAAVLAFAFYPLYQKIQKTVGVHPTFGALISTALVLMIVVLPAAFILISLMKEAVELYQRISSYISGGSLQYLIEQIQRLVTNEWAERIGLEWELVREDLTNLLLAGGKRIANLAAVQLAAMTKNLLLWLLNFLLITFLLFFFFRDGAKFYRFLHEAVPLSPKNKKAISKRINETFSAIIRGQFVTSIVQGILTGAAFWALNLPLPFLFGCLTFVTTMIPVTGAASVWVPFTVYLFLIHQANKAVWLLLAGILISLSDNVLKPVLIGEKVKLPVLLLFLGLMGGLKLYGFTGIFLGPLVISLFFVLLRIYQEDYPAER